MMGFSPNESPFCGPETAKSASPAASKMSTGLRSRSFFKRLRGADVALMTAGPPRLPAPHAATVKAPRSGAFIFRSPRTRPMLPAIGPHTYTDAQWNVTTYGSYWWDDRMAPHPPTPSLSVWRDLRIPIPRCLPQVLLREMSLSSRTPGVRAPGVLNFRPFQYLRQLSDVRRRRASSRVSSRPPLVQGQEPLRVH